MTSFLCLEANNAIQVLLNEKHPLLNIRLIRRCVFLDTFKGVVCNYKYCIMLKYSLIFVIGMFWGYLNLIGLQIVVATKLNHPLEPRGLTKVSYNLIYDGTSINMTQYHHIYKFKLIIYTQINRQILNIELRVHP